MSAASEYIPKAMVSSANITTTKMVLMVPFVAPEYGGISGAMTPGTPLVPLCPAGCLTRASAENEFLTAGYRNANQTRPIPKATKPAPASISAALCGPENNPVPCPNQKSPTAINSGPTTRRGSS